MRASVLLFMAAAASAAQPLLPLPEWAKQARAHNVTIEPAIHHGRPAVRVAEPAGEANDKEDKLAILAGTEGFGDGTIEVELAGRPGPGASGQARGFVGIAFRVATGVSRFECLYLRPTNGRAEDQVRRNHSSQYISFPEFPWHRSRKETPEKYEAYVDLEPDAWTKVRIEVRGSEARLFVHGQAQPTLIVHDLKHGASARGAVALWIGPGTVAHFGNLRVTPPR